MTSVVRLTLTLAVAAGLSLGLLAAPAASTETSRRMDVTLTAPLYFGETLLEPGEYWFQHRVIDGKPFLVAIGKKDPAKVARVSCQSIALDEAVGRSRYYTKPGPDDVRVITEVRIRGERHAHTVVFGP